MALGSVSTASGKVSAHWRYQNNLVVAASYTKDACKAKKIRKKVPLSSAERSRRARHAGKARGHKRFCKLCRKHQLHNCAKRHCNLWKKHASLARGHKDYDEDREEDDWTREDNLVQVKPTAKAKEAKKKKAKANKIRYVSFACRRRRTFDKAGNPVKPDGKGNHLIASRSFIKKNIAVAPGPIGYMTEMSKSIKGSTRSSTRRLRVTARRYATKWLIPYARFIRTRKFPSLRKLLQAMIWLHDLGMTRQLRATKRVADRVYRKTMRGKKCKICWLLGDSKSSPRLSLELAKGKMPKQVKHNDLSKLISAVSDLERANFIFGDRYDVGFGLYDILVYLRRYKPKVKSAWGKKQGRGMPTPVKQYQQMCKQRGGCWINAHLKAMEGFGSIGSTIGFMSKLPLALDANGAVSLQRKAMPWVFDFYQKWMPALLRGRYVTVLGRTVDQYRQAGYTEKNNPMVCWGSTVLMKLHRGNGWFYPAHYSIGQSALGKFHWTAAALSGLHDRSTTVDPAYARYMAALLKKARFATKDSDDDMDDYNWKTNHVNKIEKTVEQTVVRKLITKKGRNNGGRHARKHRDDY